MTDQTKIAEELAEPHHFGSHNIYMPTAPVGHFLPYYPWRTLYEQLPFEGAYPQLLYINSQADALFDALSLRLAELVADENFCMEVSLQYPMGIPVEEVREGYLTLIVTDPSLDQRLEGLPVEVPRELWLDMLAMSLIHYILQTEIAPEEQVEVALVEMPHEGTEEESEEVRPLWVKQWEHTQEMIRKSDGAHRYRYGFSLTLASRTPSNVE
ncbi:MAG: hypothetical protein SOX65_00865 [Porphyromonas sp.]|uniref:hypothetical protein n=1 Tax=Porphyromonas sp. TaxID=1924944 RepID=UPI002A813DB9|nr:hypothetical protein [Porphyromonas sp.]MDY4245018.1 hypothetical protein [Porphyromonas sp.]